VLFLQKYIQPAYIHCLGCQFEKNNWSWTTFNLAYLFFNGEMSHNSHDDDAVFNNAKSK